VGGIVSKGKGNVHTKGMRDRCFVVFLFRLGDIEGVSRIFLCSEIGTLPWCVWTHKSKLHN
jgi:hypothetical protein